MRPIVHIFPTDGLISLCGLPRVGLAVPTTDLVEWCVVCKEIQASLARRDEFPTVRFLLKVPG